MKRPVVEYAMGMTHTEGNDKISEMETPFGKRIFIKKRKIKEQMKIILAQYFEIFQISSSGKILWQKTLWKNKNLWFL